VGTPRRSSCHRARARRCGFVAIATLVGLAIPVLDTAGPAAAADPISFTILHTNDFHGNLEAAGSNPGAARVAHVVNDVRDAVGPENVLLLDGGDIMQGSLLSNLQKGLPTIDYYRTLGYDAATLGNHEFDWGQTVLGDRIAQAEAAATADEQPMQMVAANVTTKDAGGACTWTPFNASVTPYEILTVGTAPNTVDVGVIGVSSVETPFITIASATEGLCFRDPAESILHYYDAVDAASDVIVVLSHNGFNDGGYGYGVAVYGDKTLAQKLNDASKPADLIIGAHSHTDLTAATMVGGTAVVQAHYAGRKVGRADVTFSPDTDAVSIRWTRLVVATSASEDPTIKALVDDYASDLAYQALINTPVGYVQVDLGRDYNGDNMMGSFVDDAIYGALNTDASSANDADMVFNNSGGLRADWCDKEDPPGSGTYVWSSAAADCSKVGLWSHDPMLLTYGQMYSILPFGNATAIGEMTGAQIHDLLQQSATLFKGALQPSGVRYKFFRYSDSLPGPQPYAWGAYDIEVFDKASDTWQPLEASKTYKVATNEFLAPAGQDGFTPFKYMTNISYWGDQLNLVNAYVAASYTMASPYRGPLGNGQLDGRITRNGDGDDSHEAGEVVPLTVLHHNDSHGRLLKSGSTVGYSQLVTLIEQERLHNPSRTLLVSAGDNIQGDSTMYYFKSAGLGYAADGTVLPPELSINPLVKAFNAVGYDAMTLGNHEFNFGSEVFKTLAQADFPILQANLTDTDAYGLVEVPVEPYVVKTVDGIDVAILGIGNHRVPSYELPSNIAGLIFTDPIQAGKDHAPTLQAGNDVVIALTHIGFTENPASVEVDTNVDTYFAAEVPGVDAVIGGHSHTRPDTGFGAYKFLPTFVAGPDGEPVLVSQAYRYNTYLGEVVLGLLPDGSGGYETVSAAGRYLAVASDTPEDPETVALVAPYQALITAYNNTEIGQTTVPIDTNDAFTQETNGANLQADASVWKLESEGIPVDVHLSGAMTNRRIADTATLATPYTLKVSDMFTAMPYENSLVVLEMNGPQLKTVLERSYRNYYFYKYVPGYGGYSYYTTCMLDTDAGNQIVYHDSYPSMPNGNNVSALRIGGVPVDFGDASTYYRVSTVNYLAAGACNFSDSGTTLWPLGQIAADTQYYVRDAVIEYVQEQTAPIAPAIEGRLAFTAVVPDVRSVTVTPEPSSQEQPTTVAAAFSGSFAHDPHECTFDAGDGTMPATAPATGRTCSVPHTWAMPGTYTVTVTVTDAGGRTANATTSHVVHPVSQLYPSGDRTTAKAGAAVPVRFSLGGDRGMDVFSVPPFWTKGSTTMSAVGSLSYDPWTDLYQYAWKTPKNVKGLVTLTFTFAGGVTRTLTMTLT
jgi:2',3'-cyclic-nucleotide 2'-phosphodiesterase (5'-nucleotidase family)